MTHFRRNVVLVSLTALALVAACGSDEKRLTAAQFLAQGNAVCEVGNQKITAVTAKFTAELTPDEEKAWRVQPVIATAAV